MSNKEHFWKKIKNFKILFLIENPTVFHYIILYEYKITL